MSRCRHAVSTWTGYISNQPDAPPIDHDRPLLSQTVCARETCRAAVKAHVEQLTGEPAHYRDFKRAES